MANEIDIYHRIPIYLKQSDRDSSFWLQWKRGRIRYGVLVKDMSEALGRAHQMIDAMLELECSFH